MKLAAKKQPCQTRGTLDRTLAPKQIQKNNEKVQELIHVAKPSESAGTVEVRAEILNLAAARALTPIPTNQKKQYISEQKMANPLQEATNPFSEVSNTRVIEKQLRKHLRQDKPTFHREQLEKMTGKDIIGKG